MYVWCVKNVQGSFLDHTRSAFKALHFLKHMKSTFRLNGYAINTIRNHDDMLFSYLLYCIYEAFNRFVLSENLALRIEHISNIMTSVE